MATSPNYAWAEPDNSSLVKNGAADIRTLGDAIDTSVWNVGFGQASKNKIINSDFRISQRGTTFTNPSSGAYTLDRFSVVYDGTITSHTVSQQTFSPGTAPVAGYEGSNFARWAITTNGTSTYRLFTHRVEDVRVFAGQQITFSFWIKADSARTLTNATYGQNFGSGGSGTVESTFTLSTTSITTSWQRITGTATVPSISGKTIGTGSNFFVYLSFPTAGTFDMWGWQVEYGAKATPFQTASGGSPQAELAMCQRYYYQINSGSQGIVSGTTNLATKYFTPVTFRTTPTPTTNITNANYASLWNLYPIGAAASTKSGTVTISLTGNLDGVFIALSGATFAGVPQQFQVESTGAIYLSAEL
jgi:hypothetical protein